ncbi:hypothetical protein [Bradyrhizobium tropiciagri]|uniref:hypothetical protein n=1 Tax=Bradyrhizobium tropiciagri TaxID=312253 RepID=UPI00067C2C56|nr:hypothetical protein [Bradyrhizobium tropiciagri]
MLSRALSLLLVLILSGTAVAAEAKKIGVLAAFPPGDTAAAAQSQSLVVELKKAGLVSITREAHSPAEALTETRALVEADRVDILIIRASFFLWPGVFLNIPINLPVVVFNVPLEIPQAVYVGYNPVEVGKAQIGFLGAQGSKQLLLLDGSNISFVKELISAGQWQALSALSNMKAAADCGGCPKTGDCPKGNSAKACPCPKTGDCPKSDITDLITSQKIDGVAVLEPRFLTLVHDQGLADKGVRWVAPIPTVDSLAEVAENKQAFAIDPQPIVPKVVEVAANLLAKASPKDVAGISKISSNGGDRFAVFLPLKLVTDPNAAKVILNTLQAH